MGYSWLVVGRGEVMTPWRLGVCRRPMTNQGKETLATPTLIRLYPIFVGVFLLAPFKTSSLIIFLLNIYMSLSEKKLQNKFMHFHVIL